MVMSMYLSIMARILLCSRDAFSQVTKITLLLYMYNRSEICHVESTK